MPGLGFLSFIFLLEGKICLLPGFSLASRPARRASRAGQTQPKKPAYVAVSELDRADSDLVCSGQDERGSCRIGSAETVSEQFQPAHWLT